jgi:hypothetical protein
MCTKSGKIICATFFAKSLDKMLGLWYNGISGPSAREGAANYTTIGEFCQVALYTKIEVVNPPQLLHLLAGLSGLHEC